MKTVVPLNSVDEIATLAQEGADEFFLGCLDAEWVCKYSAVSGNRREWLYASFTNTSDVAEAVTRAHALGCTINVALNERYTEGQYGDLRRLIEGLVDAGVDALILADLGALLQAVDWSPRVTFHASTGMGIMNPAAVHFFRDLGVTRVILERQLRLSEMEAISSQCPDMEIEVFGIFGKEPYIDAYCSFHHGIHEIVDGVGPSGCMRTNDAVFTKVLGDGSMTETDFNPFRALNTLEVDGCCACVMPKFTSAGIEFAKIVGRGQPTARKCKGLRMLKSCLEHLRQCSDIEDYRAFCRNRFAEVFGYPCSALNCYYVQDSGQPDGAYNL